MWLIPWWYKHAWSSVGHPKGLASGLKGGFLGRSPSGQLLLGESSGCPPFDG